MRLYKLVKRISLRYICQGKRTLFLSCLLEQGFSYYLVLLLKIETFVGQGLQNLDAFALIYLPPTG